MDGRPAGICNVHNVPLATNLATAEVLLQALFL